MSSISRITLMAEQPHCLTAARAATCIDAVAKAVAAHEDLQFHATVRLTQTDEIRALNSNFRGIDAETDVLSFPAFSDIEDARQNAPEYEYTEDGLLEVGDIAICVEKAQQQADEIGHSLEQEITFLVLHGLLHLLGYDHETAEDEEEMTGVQRRIMREIGVVDGAT